MPHPSSNRFSDAAKRAGIATAAELEAAALRLSRQQTALFVALYDGPADTLALRRAGVGNISAIASSLTAKLAAAGNGYRVHCETRPCGRLGEPGLLGVWSLVKSSPEVGTAA